MEDLCLLAGTLVSSEIHQMQFYEPFYNPLFCYWNITIPFWTDLVPLQAYLATAHRLIGCFTASATHMTPLHQAETSSRTITNTFLFRSPHAES